MSAVLLPVLWWLGNWQLGRADEKQVIKDQLEIRQSLPPVTITELMAEENIQYRQVTLQGKYNNQKSFLLDNRVRDGKVGYEILTPFQLNNGRIILVNRGWLAAPRLRENLPEIPAVNGMVALTGQVYQPLEHRAFQENITDNWPKVIQTINFLLLGSELELPLLAFTVRVNEGVSGSFQTGWAVVNVQPEKHIAYAVQWFLMALALIFLTFFANTNYRQWRKNKKR